MPQLDPSTFVPQLFWLAVTFLVLYLLMKHFALPKLGAVIETRQSRVDGDLARASALKSEAETVLAAYQQALAAARSEAQATLRQTSEQLAAEATERQRQLAANLADQIEEAERRIAAAKDEALSGVRVIAVDVGRAIVEKLTGAAPPQPRLEAAVAAALSERPR